MSRSAGPGSPVSFMCNACRRRICASSSDVRNATALNRGGTVTLTGRERKYTPKAYTARGQRSDLVSREYKCSCGHVGWSNHVALRRLKT